MRGAPNQFRLFVGNFACFLFELRAFSNNLIEIAFSTIPELA